jgi:hypothetical protein
MFATSLDMSRFRQLRRETKRIMGLGTQRAVEVGVKAGAEYARNNHPHETRTGNLTSELHLRGSVLERFADGATGEITNDASYARFVEYGTRPHEIWPKEGHGLIGPLRPSQSRRAITDIGTHRVALRFVIGGRTVFARMVHHPGGKPYPFMEPAGSYAEERIIYETESVTFELAAALWD